MNPTLNNKYSNWYKAPRRRVGYYQGNVLKLAIENLGEKKKRHDFLKDGKSNRQDSRTKT